MTHSPAEPSLVHDIALHCEDQLGRPMAFMATFGYQSADPYAVRITFHLPAGDIPWLVARGLLARGMTEPVGEGDVRLHPALDEEGHAVTVVVFHSPAGRLRVEVRSSELREFLDGTEELVTLGEESVDLDDLVASLRS